MPMFEVCVLMFFLVFRCWQSLYKRAKYGGNLVKLKENMPLVFMLAIWFTIKN